MDLTGRIIAVLEPRGGVSARTGNAWKTQEYVLEVPGTYPRRMVFNIFGEDRINQFNIQNGEDLTVQFDIDAREYQGRWFNDIRAYNIIRGQVPGAAPGAVPGAAPAAIPGAAPFPPQQPMGQQPAMPQDAAAFPPQQEGAPAENSADDLPF